MPRAIILAGGDEFRSNCVEMDSQILRATEVEAPRVLIVPTAAVTGPQKAASDGVRHFSQLGADASALMVLDEKHANDEELIAPVSEASVVYFTGGSPDHLLGALRGSALFSHLKEMLGKGMVLGGSSAGAMVLGSMMRRPSSRGWVEGLGVAEGVGVLPHHERSDPSTVAAELARSAPADLKVLGIDAQTCCFGAPGSWKVLGSGKVTAYDKGSWTTFSAGESLPTSF